MMLILLENMNKIIFLDIDGVLNVFNDGTDNLGHLFNPIYLQNLIELVSQTQAKIVVVSNWKHLIRKIISERNYDLEIYDIADDLFLHRDTYGRSKEIDLWLEKHPETTHYVILDDVQQYEGHHQYHLVKTSGNEFHPEAFNGYGFTKQCLEKAIRLLTN